MAKSNVNSLQVSDIVSVKTMIDIAKIIRNKAAQIAKSKRAPLAPERSGRNKYHPNNIGIKQPETTKNQIKINLTLHPVALAFEYGSGKHGKGEYPITPKNKPSLVFEYPKNKIYDDVKSFDKDGKSFIITNLVMHPGVESRPFLEPAKRQTAKERRELLEKEVGRNIRTIVSGMARVVK